ncbi:hypothetical protein BpHYR1_028215 [Brachionus plicatilis]|uniref:Uncharacterized protein n=1 Tax=Brachionus plicatilis TaxID=10195 RepID=A0A3M7QZX5_BRAPC|nr:hypothetical protein BpHYR1_028215 [Brachionus plicatilis]
MEEFPFNFQLINLFVSRNSFFVSTISLSRQSKIDLIVHWGYFTPETLEDNMCSRKLFTREK